jgi:hypothetical protein
MPYPKSLPDSGTLAQLRRTQTIREIAETYGVTEVAVHYALHDAGLTEAAAPRVMPWTLRAEHKQARPANMIRTWFRRERGDTDIPPYKLRSLELWLEELEDLGVVVDYDPEAPPNPASPIHGGFIFVDRRKVANNGVFRLQEAAAP